jgi:hypothetical protein
MEPHLIIMMPAANYLTRVSQAFVSPIHPGPAPVHAVNAATNAQITETNHQYAADLAEHSLYRSVNE